MDTNGYDLSGLDMGKAKEGAAVAVTPNDGGLIEITVRGQGTLTFNPMKASLINRRRAEFHGWKQRLVDAAAVSADTTTGRTDPAEKFTAIRDIIAFYEEGGDDWARRVAKDGAGRPGDVIQAMVNLGKARDVDHANGRVDAAAAKRGISRDEMIKALAGAGDIKAEIVRIRAERAAASNPLNADALLDGMDDE